MIEISLNHIEKSFGFKKLLNDLELEIKTGDRVSIIGENGCGKTTILNMISNIENPDSGTVAIRKGSVIGYLPQQPELNYNGKKIKEILYESVKDILEIENTMKKYEEKMTEDPTNMDIIRKYSNIQEKFIGLGGYEINTWIEKVIHGMNIQDFTEKYFEELSGGEQKRVSLATLMIKKPDILILDEPTNHLDIHTLEWLESYLNKYEGTVIIVSHDRYFLDKVTNKTILIENGKAIPFHGNYSYYLKENDLRIEREFQEYKDQQKQIQAMQKKIKQLQEFGRLAFPYGESFFRRAENIRKRLERIEVKEKPQEKKELPMHLSFDQRSGNDALAVRKYDLVAYDRILIKNINFVIHYGEKVCMIGDNGCGKTTFIKQILNPNSNHIKVGSNVKIGYIPQQISFEENCTILEYARKFFIGEESHLRSALDKFDFHGDNVFKKVNTLSGGEKVRLKLLELIHNKSNFIILDEPTNHIDIYTKETLENALKEFDGTVLFISHDRYFINQLADKILYIHNQTITVYPGNYDYLIEHKNNML